MREPAWSLSRSAISLWVTEGVIGSLFLGICAAVFVIFVPDDLGGPFPVLRWLVPVAVVVYAVVAIGSGPGSGSGCTAGRSPARRSTRSPAG